LGKGVSNLTQTFNKFFKIKKQEALGNTNKAVKDLNSTPSFNFVQNSMGNFKLLGTFEDQTGEKKEASLVGEAAYIRPLIRRDFFALQLEFTENCKNILKKCLQTYSRPFLSAYESYMYISILYNCVF
jgi:hypothetical protein